MKFHRLFLAVSCCSLGWACAAPGGILSGVVRDEAGNGLPEARIEVDFGDAVFDTTTDAEGRFLTGWSHGTWNEIVVTASAAARQRAVATIGWGNWDCEFTLVPEGVQAPSSTADCRNDVDDGT